MTKRLNVLLVESHPWVGESAAQHLTDAGHQVHRCHEQGDVGFTCVGLGSDNHCPVDAHIDAAVLVRADGNPVPTPHEDGVRCAIRAGVPVVEVGSAETDPFADWVALRADEATLPAACAAAVELAKEPMVEAITAKLAPLFDEAGIDPAGATYRIQTTWPDLDVHITAPGTVGRSLEQAASVRAYDALRPMTTAYKTVNVTVQGRKG